MESNTESLVAGIVQITALIGIVAGIWYVAFVLPKKIDKAFRAFAELHGLPHFVTGRISYKGVIAGHSIRTVGGIDAKTGRMAEMFHFEHVVGSGKNRREYERTVVSLSIKSTKAHVIVNSELNDLSETPGLHRSQRYEAEGNFGKYFDMYFPGGEQVKALSLFAPDVLNLIMAEFGHYDIEVVDNILYVYTYTYLKKTPELENFYALANRLAAAIDDNRPRTLRFAQVPERAAGSSTAMQRLRSNKVSLATIIAVCGVIAFYVLPIFMSTHSDVIGVLIPLMFLVGALVVTLGRATRIGMKRRAYAKERHIYDDSSKG